MKTRRRYYSHRRYRRQRRTYKRGGERTAVLGTESSQVQRLDTTTTPPITPDQLQQAREQANKHLQEQTMQPINNFIANTSTLAHNFVTNLGNKIGIDVTNKQALKSQIHSAAETGAELLEAADPFIQPLVDKTIAEGEKAASKIGEAAIKIGLNTAEEIPGVGVVIGTVRSLSNAGEALTAAMNAAAEITTTTADTVNATTQNWKRLQAEKMATLSRTQKSIQQFAGGL